MILKTLLNLILMEIDRSLDPSVTAKLGGGLEMPVPRTHMEPTRKTTASRQLPSSPGLERTDMDGNNRVARRRALVSKSLNDEQWSDDLVNPSLIRPPGRRSR